MLGALVTGMSMWLREPAVAVTLAGSAAFAVLLMPAHQRAQLLGREPGDR